MSDQDYYYAVKVKHVDTELGDEVYEEFTYRIANSPRFLPSEDDDLGFLGFDADREMKGIGNSYVCTDVMCIDRGSRSDRKLKEELAKEPHERTVGGL